jgi:hypothetical protein
MLLKLSQSEEKAIRLAARKRMIEVFSVESGLSEETRLNSAADQIVASVFDELGIEVTEDVEQVVERWKT